MAVAVVSAVLLVFYSVGIVTKFFALPMFRAFWVVSLPTANIIALYSALALDAVLAGVVVGKASMKVTNKSSPSSLSSPLKIKGFSSVQKVWVAASVAVCSLVFYAVGVSTAFFGSPVFSHFWWVSAGTARGIVVYSAGAFAAVTVIALAVNGSFGMLSKASLELFLFKNHRITSPVKLSALRARMRQVSHKATSRFLTPFRGEDVGEDDGMEFDPQIRMSLQNKSQLSTKPTFQPSSSPPLLPSENVLAAEGLSVISGSGRMACLNCKKEFNEPLFKLDFVNRLPRLILSCPHCNHSLGFEWKSAVEKDDDPWKRVFKPS